MMAGIREDRDKAITNMGELVENGVTTSASGATNAPGGYARDFNRDQERQRRRNQRQHRRDNRNGIGDFVEDIGYEAGNIFYDLLKLIDGGGMGPMDELASASSDPGLQYSTPPAGGRGPTPGVQNMDEERALRRQ
jgi:hypothetical protein